MAFVQENVGLMNRNSLVPHVTRAHRDVCLRSIDGMIMVEINTSYLSY